MVLISVLLYSYTIQYYNKQLLMLMSVSRIILFYRIFTTYLQHIYNIFTNQCDIPYTL